MWRDQINSKEITVRCWKVLKNYNEKINSRILSRIRNTDMLDYIMRFHQNGNSITVAFLVTFLISPKHLSTKDFVCKKFERDFTQKNWLQNHHWSFFSCHRSLSIPLKILEKIGYATFCTCFICPFLSFNV